MSLLLTRQRQDEIRLKLERDGRVVAGALAREFGVSEDTVRRDLREMAAAGLCERVYGGALPLAPRFEPFVDRQAANADVKRRLGEATARLVPDGASVFIDAGSTNVAVARALARNGRLTVITNSPAVAIAVPAGIETVVVGGRFDAALGACVGARALRDVEGFTPDVMILGVCGVDAEAGITAFSQEEAVLKERVAAAARQVMVASTADKLGTAAPFRVASADRLHHLVTEGGVDPVLIKAFEAHGTTVHSIQTTA